VIFRRAVAPADHEVGEAVAPVAVRVEAIDPLDGGDHRLRRGGVAEREQSVGDLVTQAIEGRPTRHDATRLPPLEVHPDVALQIGAQRECPGPLPRNPPGAPHGDQLVAKRGRYPRRDRAPQLDRNRLAQAAQHALPGPGIGSSLEYAGQHLIQQIHA